MALCPFQHEALSAGIRFCLCSFNPIGWLRVLRTQLIKVVRLTWHNDVDSFHDLLAVFPRVSYEWKDEA
jgi:hypothetical protein